MKRKIGLHYSAILIKRTISNFFILIITNLLTILDKVFATFVVFMEEEHLVETCRIHPGTLFSDDISRNRKLALAVRLSGLYS